MREKIKNKNSKEFVQSISDALPAVPLNPCKNCLSNNRFMVVVNYLTEEPVEYFGFVMCLKCGEESDGGGILYDYHKAVISAQNAWNTENPGGDSEPKNQNESEQAQ